MVEKFEKNIWLFLFLVIVAYLFSFGVRLYWPLEMAGNPNSFWNGELMISTNDGYYFATAIADMIQGVTRENFGAKSVMDITPAFVYATVFLHKLLPISLETLLIYMPAIISSLIVIPIILSFRLFHHTFLGFLAALIGSIAWSYYNRTMAGYFDSDMFALFLMFLIFYSLLRIAYKKDLSSVVFAAVLISLYPFFYPQGLSIIYAMFFILIAYFALAHFELLVDKETVQLEKSSSFPFVSLAILSVALIFALPLWVKLAVFVLLAAAAIKLDISQQRWFYFSLVMLGLFLVFGNVLNVLTVKLIAYLDRGVKEEGLHFYQVINTVREAGQIPWSVVADRISGSSIGLMLSLLGYVVLVLRHKSFIVALPLIGVGLFSYVGGLRFTVYAVPIAAIGAVYLFWVIGGYLKGQMARYAFVVVATAGMLYPNIMHIKEYIVPTVMNKTEVEDLVKLKEISNPKDYTIAWWDYGYPIWYYSSTNTIIDGGKHHNDNFIVSTVLQTSSQQLAANLSRLAVETYVSSDYLEITDTLFKNKTKEQIDPNMMLDELESDAYALPAKTRDVYIYLPYRMLNIFPTVALFGNLDLKSGKPKREMIFSPGTPINKQNEWTILSNGLAIDMAKGLLTNGKQEMKINKMVISQTASGGEVKNMSRVFFPDGQYSVVYMQNYNNLVIMDNETLNSAYVQMFMLEHYDANLFELVVRSPYTKIYRLKK